MSRLQLQVCRVFKSAVVSGGTLRDHLAGAKLDGRHKQQPCCRSPSSLPLPSSSAVFSHQAVSHQAVVSAPPLAFASAQDPSPVSTVCARARPISLKNTCGVFDSATYSLGTLGKRVPFTVRGVNYLI